MLGEPGQTLSFSNLRIKVFVSVFSIMELSLSPPLPFLENSTERTLQNSTFLP